MMNKMNEHKFAVGDRVIYNPKRTGNGWLAGEHGTVIYVDNTPAPYTVEFDERYPDGVTDERAKSVGHHPKSFHGWFCREGNLQREDKRDARAEV